MIIFGGYAGIPEKSVFALAFCLVFTVWIVMLLNMTQKKRLRSIGIAAFFTVGLILAAGEEYRLVFVEEYFWAIWIICFSFGALIAGILMNRSIWIKRAMAAGLIGYCTAATIMGIEISKGTFTLICFMLLVRLAEEIQNRWKKSGRPDMKEHITRISPFFLAVCMVVFMLPFPSKPFSWQFAKNIYYSTVSCFNRLYGLIAHPSDDYGNIGFSDNGKFLSGLNENDQEVLRITTEYNRLCDMRLVGCVSGEFKGREWVFETDKESRSRTLDTIETSGAVRKYAAADRSDYLRDVAMRYDTYFYNTQYVFAPTKIRFEATREHNPHIIEKNGSIMSDKTLRYKDKYSVISYVLNYGNPHLRELLTNAEPFSEEEWEQAAAAEGALDMAGCSFEDYQKYRKDIYEKYCRSYGVSDDVRRIIDEIKNSSSSRYEAVKKLELYLRQLEYSTDCGALPDSVDDAASFLDHFLLTSRKGYCMHFATAFVLMANEMGIPCRYVQGYNAVEGSYGQIIVKESNAHAWAEVYFDNVGWVTFEPTPGYAVSAGWKVADKNAAETEEEIEFPELDSLKPDPNEEQEEEKTAVSPLIFIIPSLAVMSFLVMYYIISRSVTGKRYRTMSGADKYRHLTQQNLRFLGYLGCPIKSGETLSEYMERLNGSDREDIKEHLGFIPVYETVIYSDAEITEKQIVSAEKTNSALRELVKKSSLRSRLLLLIKNQ